MIFPNRLKQPQALMSIGMLFLVIALAWPRYIHLNGGLGPGWIDGVRGMLFGVSIGINLMSVRLAGRRRRCDGT